ncbi:beta-1,4 N-acetylgalactosaminyltransferase 1-like [Branchiostoma floridae x Branchiostoma belcheri]
MAEKRMLLLLFLTAYICGIVTLGTMSALMNLLENSVMPSKIQSKRNIIASSHIPFTLRGDFLDSKRMGCNCSDKGATISNFKYFEINELKEVEQRRKAELRKFKIRTETTKETLMIVNGSVPLSYPVQGVVVAPEEWENIPGLRVDDYTVHEHYKVKLSSSKFGVLDARATVPGVNVDGLGTTLLNMSSRSLDHLNRQLEFVVYVNTVFDIDARDYVHFVYLQHEVVFPIVVRVRKAPILYDLEPGDINNKVTIITKTFLRYSSVRLLLQSIQKYYPKMRVVVADDSRPIEDLQSEYVDHYVMPFASGWFGGRNLAVSQVTTPYLLWVDDDFVFTEETKLEVMVDILDNSNLDLVSGVLGGMKAVKMALIPGIHHDDGFCISYKPNQNYGQVPGFPNCYFVTRVTNFFMGRTDGVRSVGFYPAYSRCADREFYLEGLGKLRMAACRGIRIYHNQTRNTEYVKYRFGGDIENYRKITRGITYFRNNIDCWHK